MNNVNLQEQNLLYNKISIFSYLQLINYRTMPIIITYHKEKI